MKQAKANSFAKRTHWSQQTPSSNNTLLSRSSRVQLLATSGGISVGGISVGVIREHVALNSGAETVRSMSTQGGGQCQSLCTSWDSSRTQATCILATLHVSLWNSIHVSAEKRNCWCRVSFKALTSCRNTEQLGPLHSPCRCFFSGLKVRLCLPKCNFLHGEESD